jgi:hypothetical protein
MSRRGNYQDSITAPINRASDDDAVARDDEDEQDDLSFEVDPTSVILSAVEKVLSSLLICFSILILLPSFEKSSALYDQVPNANRVGSSKLLHPNTISPVMSPINDRSC